MQVNQEFVDKGAALRKLNIKFPIESVIQVKNNLILFGRKYDFAVSIFQKDSNSLQQEVKLYRSDIKLLGELNTVSGVLELMVYRTFRNPVSKAAIDQGVNGLKATLSLIKDIVITETVILSGDNQRWGANSFSSILNASIDIPEGRIHDVRTKLVNFSDEKNLSILFYNSTPDLNKTSAYIFGNGIAMIIQAPFNNNELDVGSYHLNEPDIFNNNAKEIYETLRLQVEGVPGVKFRYVN